MSMMKSVATLSALAAAIGQAHATVYLAGDSTMAKNGANDGVTDGEYPPTLLNTTHY